MEKLFTKVQNLLSIFTDLDGAFKYQVTLDGNDIVIIPSHCFDSVSSSAIACIAKLKSELSQYLDCDFYVSSRDDKPYIRFYIFIK